MRTLISSRLLAVSLAGIVSCCVLGLYGTSDAQVPQAPFANAVEQQAEIIGQLKELNAQIKEQNALLRSGRLQSSSSSTRTRPKRTRSSVNVIKVSPCATIHPTPVSHWWKC